MGRKGATRKRNKPPVSYAEIDREEVSVGNPIDIAVHRRVERGRLYRRLVRTSQAVVDALGKRSRVWFDYERVLSRLTDLRQAAYFDLGVEHGVAAARSGEMQVRKKVVQKLAARLVREVLASDLPQDERAASAALATWALLKPTARARQRLR